MTVAKRAALIVAGILTFAIAGVAVGLAGIALYVYGVAFMQGVL